MRVVHIVTVIDGANSYGGPVTVAVNQCRQLAAHGHDVLIVGGWLGPGAPPEDIEGVTSRLFPVSSRLPGSRFSSLVSIDLLRYLVTHVGAGDVAHVHLARDLVPLLSAGLLRVRRVPYVTQTHGMVRPDRRISARAVDLVMTRPTLRAAHDRLVLTDDERSDLASVAQCSPHLMTVLPNGVPLRGPTHVPPGPWVEVLFLARLHPRKRVMDFAVAAERLADQHPTARFRIVGPDDGDGEQLRQWLHERPHLVGRLAYEGPLPHSEATSRLAQCDVYVLPSVQEPFPMTLLEAMAAGVASVCTTSCGIAKVLADAGAALVVTPGADSVEAAVSALLTDPGLRAEVGQKARLTAEHHFSIESVAARLASTYDNAVQARPSSSLLWVTNIPTPYRAPLWHALGESVDLNVCLMARTEPGRDWRVSLDEAAYRSTWLEAAVLANIRNSTLYAPSLRLLRLISDRPVGVVIDGWESPAYLAARWWAKRRRVPVIASYRSTSVTHRFRRGPVAALRRWFFTGVDAVVTAGPSSTSAVLALGVSPDKVVEGFNTVDVDRFSRALDRRRGGRTGHTFLYVGQFLPRKNLLALVDAFAKVAAPDDRLHLVGTGATMELVRESVQRQGLGYRVGFLGHLDGDALVAAYADADTFVLPSTQEVWGLVANEALAAGLQVVITETCGATDSIRGFRGVYACLADAASLAEAMRASRRDWRGPIRDSEVLAHTPAALAHRILQTVGSLDDRSSHRAQPVTAMP